MRTFVEGTEWPTDLCTFLHLVKKKVFLVGGETLLHLLFLAFAANIGMVRRDEQYERYVPPGLNNGNGSIKWLKARCGIHAVDAAHDHILSFSKLAGLRASTYENTLCKLYIVHADTPDGPGAATAATTPKAKRKGKGQAHGKAGKKKTKTT